MFKNLNHKHSIPISFLVGICLLLVGIVLGWFLKNNSQNSGIQVNQQGRPLRLAGYTYISPLLVCDTNPNADSRTLTNLENAINTIISSSQLNQDIESASVYFRDLATGNQINLNGSEKYFPASLKKVPVMMAYYKQAETDPSLLTKKGILKGDQDFNSGVEIYPRQKAEYGKEYSVDDLINYSIAYSDNISYEFLSKNLGDDAMKNFYHNLQINYPDDELQVSDYITAHQYSFFFRVLYNATYLNADYSEKALKLLSAVDYKNGLVAGVPGTVKVAHKFGILTDETDDHQIKQRELHDCGIVYDPKNPFLLCVMTKSKNQLSRAENLIKDISAAAYAEADGGYK